MTDPWLPAYVFIGLSFAAAFGTLIAAKLLRVVPATSTADKYATYECGEEPDGGSWVRFHPRYYVVALVFVLFEVEALFLLPWALSLRSLGPDSILRMVLFLGILMLGWVYALRKGALQWQS